MMKRRLWAASQSWPLPVISAPKRCGPSAPLNSTPLLEKNERAGPLTLLPTHRINVHRQRYILGQNDCLSKLRQALAQHAHAPHSQHDLVAIIGLRPEQRRWRRTRHDQTFDIGDSFLQFALE